MADYVLSAKGTYDGSNFDSGVDGSASKLKGLTETAKGVGSAGWRDTSQNSFGSSCEVNWQRHRNGYRRRYHARPPPAA